MTRCICSVAALVLLALSLMFTTPASGHVSLVVTETLTYGSGAYVRCPSGHAPTDYEAVRSARVLPQYRTAYGYRFGQRVRLRFTHGASVYVVNDSRRIVHFRLWCST